MWMGHAQMARATDVERSAFVSILNCLSDIELARPFLIKDSQSGKSLGEIAAKYQLTKAIVRHQIKCAKIYHTKSKESIKE